MTEPVTVVCTKWGTLYGPEYVNALQHGVSRHLTRPHRFVCFTDEPDGVEAECLPLSAMLTGKERDGLFATHGGGISKGYPNLMLFRRDFPFKGRVLYLDLDVVIVGGLDPLLDYTQPFVAIWDWWAKNWNGSVNLFTAGFRPSLWEQFPPADLRSLCNGQDWLLRQVPDGTQWPDAWMPSYKIHCQQGLPEFAKIVVFHGSPKPHEVTDPWVKEHWHGLGN